MAQKSSYTDVVHHIVRDSEEALGVKDIVTLFGGERGGESAQESSGIGAFGH